MKDLNYLNIALIYLGIINVATFFTYGLDKWKAKRRNGASEKPPCCCWPSWVEASVLGWA